MSYADMRVSLLTAARFSWVMTEIALTIEHTVPPILLGSRVLLSNTIRHSSLSKLQSALKFSL
jgi:hypothetical protein